VPLFAICAQSVFAQNLGEIARREHARNKQNPPAHVYTNDDMKRSEILLPQDRARIEAGQKQEPLKQDAPVNAAAPAPQLRPARPAVIPLGDVARYYRELYRLESQRQNAREKVLPASPALAIPKLTTSEIILRPTRRAPQPQGLRDPFSRARRGIPANTQSSLPASSRIPKQAPVPQETPMAAAESVVVRRGDSLWKLAARYLGEGAKWHAILAANPQLSDPNRILVGERLSLPNEVQAPAQTPSAGTLRVQRGDSMWKLAQNHLGSGFAWGCIAQANPQIQDANRIYPGQILNVPAACSERGAETAVQVSRVLPTARASH
jgi:nucleoid-associated protein YgaU